MAQQARAHHRRQRQRDEARDDDGAGEREGELEEQASGFSRREGDRRIDGRQRQRHGDDGEADLARAFDGRLDGLHAVLDVAVDVFQHDDGVVDDEADGEHHGEQRQRVDAEAEGEHQREGRDQRDRDGDDRDQRGADRSAGRR